MIELTDERLARLSMWVRANYGGEIADQFDDQMKKNAKEKARDPFEVLFQILTAYERRNVKASVDFGALCYHS